VADSAAHGKTVLAAILGGKGSIKALDYAARYLSESHFEDRTQRTLFILAQRYADQTRGILPRHALEDLLRSHPAGTSQLHVEYFDHVAARHPTVSDFRHSVTMLRELAQERETGEALAQGMAILSQGATVGKEEVRGHAAARAYVAGSFADIERDAAAGEAPEGDIRLETARLHDSYARAREQRMSGHSAGIGTGIEKLDDVLSGGLANGEFALVAGFSSAGKSQWVAQQAWHASMMQGKNVVLFSSETTRANMQVRIIGRHSRLEKFGIPGGINTRDIRAGTLDGDQYKAFRAVLDDYKSSAYSGRCYIVQLPRGATMSMLEARLSAISRQFTPDLVEIDYLALMRPEALGHRRERREELTLLLQDAKQLSVTFKDGRGVPVISPWQVSRTGRREVSDRGYYLMSDLAETAEAERSPDVIISLLDPEQDDSRGRRVPLKLDVMKNREAERFVRVELTADFANSYFEVSGGPADDSLLNPLMEEEDD
jgi:replicative DNA helicase